MTRKAGVGRTSASDGASWELNGTAPDALCYVGVRGLGAHHSVCYGILEWGRGTHTVSPVPRASFQPWPQLHPASGSKVYFLIHVYLQKTRILSPPNLLVLCETQDLVGSLKK